MNEIQGPNNKSESELQWGDAVRWDDDSGSWVGFRVQIGDVCPRLGWVIDASTHQWVSVYPGYIIDRNGILVVPQ